MLTFFLLVVLLGAAPAPPVAVIHGVGAVVSGALVVLDGSDSVTARPLVWKQLGGPTCLSVLLPRDDQAAAALMLPKPPDGAYRFALVARGAATADDAPVDVAVVDFTVGVPAAPMTAAVAGTCPTCQHAWALHDTRGCLSPNGIEGHHCRCILEGPNDPTPPVPVPAPPARAKPTPWPYPAPVAVAAPVADRLGLIAFTTSAATPLKAVLGAARFSADAAAVSAAMRAQAASPIADPQAYVDAALGAMHAAMGADVAAWLPFRAALSARFTDLFTRGLIRRDLTFSAGDLSEAWAEIAAGLEAVK